MKKTLCLLLCAAFLAAIPMTALAATEGAVPVSVAQNTDSAAEDWLRQIFPKLRGITSERVRFVFNTAPQSIKTRAVLDKKGTTLTLYRFSGEATLNKAKALIVGNAIVSAGGTTVYVDTMFPATWYYNDAENMVALYCGADAKVNEKLLKQGYSIAGEYGGYFDDRTSISMPNGWTHGSPPKGDETPATSIKGILKRTSDIHVVQVEKQAKWNSSMDYDTYTLRVVETIRGTVRPAISLREFPGALHKGRTYVLMSRMFGTQDAYGPGLILAEEVFHFIFEVDDRGYVLPVRAYGMKAPVKLEKFLKQFR